MATSILKSTYIQTNRATFRLVCAALLLATAIALRTFWWNNTPVQLPQLPIESSSQAAITQLRAQLQRNPDDSRAYAQLGLGLLEQVRITGDLSLYAQAERAFAQALEREPNQIDALMGHGILALARHDFETALDWAAQAQTVNPFRAQIVGIQVDAYVELGRYAEAVAAAQQMVDLRPDLQSYSRVSYIRELHGDVDGAIEAMQAAVDSGVPGTEAWLWSQSQLGNLYFNKGDLAAAEGAYRSALDLQPSYAPALAELADLQAAQGRYQNAIEIYEELLVSQPNSHFAVHLGEIYAAIDEPAMAQKQYDLVSPMQKIEADAGMNVEAEVALFSVEHGDDLVLALEQARATYTSRPTIYAADTLAWALYQNGKFEEAMTYAQEALRLDTQDALLYYHAGMIASGLEDNGMTQQYMSKALSLNPYFEIADAIVAQEMLEALNN